MSKRVIPVVVIVVVLAAVGGYFLLKGNGNGGELTVSGNIEVTDAAVAFQLPGRMVERLVSEGQDIMAGDLVARLDSLEYEQQVELARASLNAAQARLAELEAGTRSEEISRAGAQLKQAKAQLAELKAGSRSQEVARAESALSQAQAQADAASATLDLRAADLARSQQLYTTGVIPASQYDQAETAWKTTGQQLATATQQVAAAEQQLSLVQEGPRLELIEQAEAGVAQAASVYQLAVNGPRAETIEHARAQVEGARQQLELAQTRLAYCELRSPMSGVVLADAAEAGEYVQPGTPVVTLADIEHVWLRAYVNESDLGRVQLGQRVQVTTDTYPGKAYDGTISFIASEAEFTPKQVQTHEQRVQLVYRIKIDVANPGRELKPGMPADALISVDGEQ